MLQHSTSLASTGQKMRNKYQLFNDPTQTLQEAGFRTLALIANIEG
jgi:hypothetical protein